MKGYYGGVIPESEVRQLHRIGEDGRVGDWFGNGNANQSVCSKKNVSTPSKHPSSDFFLPFSSLSKSDERPDKTRSLSSRRNESHRSADCYLSGAAPCKGDRDSQRHPLHIPLTRGASDLTDQRLRE